MHPHRPFTDHLSSLRGKLLIAMPQMSDTAFAETVICLCEHNADGAMGLVINKEFESVSLSAVMEQLDITEREENRLSDVYVGAGGPVQQTHGFILHSVDYIRDESRRICADFALSTTREVLGDIATGRGPESWLVTLGYAGWAAHQLDREIQENGWLIVDADRDLLFNLPRSAVWTAALDKLGVAPELLSPQAGHA